MQMTTTPGQSSPKATLDCNTRSYDVCKDLQKYLMDKLKSFYDNSRCSDEDIKEIEEGMEAVFSSQIETKLIRGINLKVEDLVHWSYLDMEEEKAVLSRHQITARTIGGWGDQESTIYLRS